MATHQFVEDAPLANVRITDSGALVASVRCARTGIQDYAGFELGHPGRERIRIVRPEDAVFDPASMRTYAHRPVTNDHPDEPVTPANWREYGVGHLGDTVRCDGEYVRVDMMLSDAKAISDVQAGKVQLSAGYTADLEMFDEPRETPYGIADAAMTGFVINHVAVVDKARAGPGAAIGARDAAPSKTWGASPIATTDSHPLPAPTAGNPPAPTNRDRAMTLKTVKVRGLDIEANDAAAQAIDQLTADLAAAVQAKDALASEKAAVVTAAEVKAITDAEAAKLAHESAMEGLKDEHAAAIAEKDKEIGAKDARIDELEKAVVTPTMLDAMVTARTALVEKASKFTKDADFAGKSDAEVKAIAVDAIHGEGFSKDKPEAWVDGVFDAAKVPAGTGDAFRDAMASREHVADSDKKDNGQSAFRASLATAYKSNPRAA